MSDSKAPSDALIEALRQMLQPTAEKIRRTELSVHFTRAILDNAAKRQLDQETFALTIVNLMAIVLELTDVTAGGLLDTSNSLYNDQSVMDKFTKLALLAGLNWGPRCAGCGRFHGKETPEHKADGPQSCN